MQTDKLLLQHGIMSPGLGGGGFGRRNSSISLPIDFSVSHLPRSIFSGLHLSSLISPPAQNTNFIVCPDSFTQYIMPGYSKNSGWERGYRWERKRVGEIQRKEMKSSDTTHFTPQTLSQRSLLILHTHTLTGGPTVNRTRLTKPSFLVYLLTKLFNHIF